MNFNKVVVIGVGGTGSILISPLVRYLYSQKFDGQIIIIDGDSYSESNLDRQMCTTKHIGMNKAQFQYSVITSHLPQMKNNVDYIDRYIGSEDIDEIITENTIVINCADNNVIRRLVENKILSLETAAHICCGNELNYGQVQISLRINGEAITRSIFEEAPEFSKSSEKDDRSKMTCEQIAELPSGGQLITANMTAASFALNYLSMIIGQNDLYMEGNYIPCDITKFNLVNNDIINKGIKQVNVQKLENFLEKKLMAK